MTTTQKIQLADDIRNSVSTRSFTSRGRKIEMEIPYSEDLHHSSNLAIYCSDQIYFVAQHCNESLLIKWAKELNLIK